MSGATAKRRTAQGADARLATIACDTPLGPFVVALGDGGVAATMFDEPERALARLADQTGRPVEPASLRLDGVRREVEGYFAGRVRAFQTPADLRFARTPFTRAVAEAATRVPYGELGTYGDLAAAAGRPGAARAAGSVMASCPIELFVPCHRIVRAGRELGSYGLADDRRRFLLALEGSLPRSAPG